MTGWVLTAAAGALWLARSRPRELGRAGALLASAEPEPAPAAEPEPTSRAVAVLVR